MSKSLDLGDQPRELGQDGVCRVVEYDMEPVILNGWGCPPCIGPCHRIAGTNQHATRMDTKQSASHVRTRLVSGGMELRNA